MPNTEYVKPRWFRDFQRFLPLKSQFVLSGNVYDLQVHGDAGTTPAAVQLQAALAREFYASSYKRVVSLDLVRGVRLLSPAGAVTSNNELLSRWGLAASDAAVSADPGYISSALDRAVADDDGPTALIVDYASRLIVRNQSISAAEHSLFARAQVSALSAKPKPFGADSSPYFNTIVWIVEREGDLPDWFLVGNPRVRHIPIPRPDHIARRALIPMLLRTLQGAESAPEELFKKAVNEFVESTEGLLIADLQAITALARKERLTAERILDAVRRYKVGVTEDPWAKIDKEKVRNAAAFIGNRVKGQDHAVGHALDVIKRAITGVGTGRRGGRPRGVLFLAGPTGVGKTELAKTLTRLLFGDDNAYIRFDMSEFSAEHSDQRLIGAPPGYVGYDAGGELTNAIREKPFSVVLFDEIEKAHPRILDKFLQVLDDGVLTSGRGDRVYFTESFIVFTSNLGIYRVNQNHERIPNVTPNDSLETVTARVLAEIERYFKVELNRPEILNRIGDNIVVFDFIRTQVAVEILDQMIENTLHDVDAVGIRVEMSEEVRVHLRDLSLSDLSNGGRGIRNKVESHLVNPLARTLFDLDAKQGSRWRIIKIDTGVQTRLTLEQN